VDLIRARVLQGFSELVGEPGGDPEALLLEAHLSDAAIADLDMYISYRSVAQVVDAGLRRPRPTPLDPPRAWRFSGHSR
jgi:hypothetical protein